MSTEKKYHVPALEKAFAIIETLSTLDRPIGVSELCKKLDIPKTSVFFILNTLEKQQYIIKTEDGGYKLGNKFMSIGLNLLNKIDIRAVAKPFMNELLQQLGCTVHLAVLDNYEAMYIEKVEHQAFVKFSTYIGQRLPLHASAVGKALASQLSDYQIDELHKRLGLPMKTTNTITSLSQFKSALKNINELGYSLENEEGEIGIRCIGAPIIGHDGNLKAAISVTSLCADLPSDEIQRYGHKVREIALKISEQLGYRPAI
jgi:DNA-binding IclR family transcriptional regulator